MKCFVLAFVSRFLASDAPKRIGFLLSHLCCRTFEDRLLVCPELLCTCNYENCCRKFFDAERYCTWFILQSHATAVPEIILELTSRWNYLLSEIHRQSKSGSVRLSFLEAPLVSFTQVIFGKAVVSLPYVGVHPKDFEVHLSQRYSPSLVTSGICLH